jgi:hypothetical protein
VEAVIWATIPTELSGGQGVTNGQVLVDTHQDNSALKNETLSLEAFYQLYS